MRLIVAFFFFLALTIFLFLTWKLGKKNHEKFATLRWEKNNSPPGGLEPPTFRLTAERASRLRHGGMYLCTAIVYMQIFRFYVKSIISLLKFLIMNYYPKRNC